MSCCQMYSFRDSVTWKCSVTLFLDMFCNALHFVHVQMCCGLLPEGNLSFGGAPRIFFALGSNS